MFLMCKAEIDMTYFLREISDIIKYLIMFLNKSYKIQKVVSNFKYIHIFIKNSCANFNVL